MKVVLSRKVFDASAGGCANAIMPDGTLLPLPIPDASSPIRYGDITIAGHSLGQVVRDLTGGKHGARSGAHLDPDVFQDAVPRQLGWRPVFGQDSGAQTTLHRSGIGAGDLFLFFGWFRQIESDGGRFRFVKGAPDAHVLWGWLQVNTVLSASSADVPVWARYHPHVAGAGHSVYGRGNTLYISREQLQIAGLETALPGGGGFGRYEPRLQLTKLGARTRTLWSLPAGFAPSAGRPPLGFHRDLSRWSLDGDRVDLRTVGRGQEFVLDTALYPDVLSWVRGLFTNQGER